MLAPKTTLGHENSSTQNSENAAIAIADVITEGMAADLTSIAVFADEVVLINRLDAEVILMSPEFAAQYHCLSVGSSIDELDQELDGIRNALETFNGEGQSNKKLVLINSEKRKVSVELASCGPDKIFIRCTSLATQQNEMQRYLHDREQLFLTSRTITVSEMATTLAHEINQPIGTIKNLLHGIKKRINQGVDQLETCDLAIDRAMEQTEFAARIINRIRDYTQAREPQRELSDFHAIVKDCLSLLDWEVDREGIVIELNFTDELLQVWGDVLMLQQVVVNLLRNAIDAMRNSEESDRKLLIATKKEAGHAMLRIEDSGCGLDEEGETTLFQPFVSSKPGGMGVGLNICRSFIELHQGRLWLTSNEGAGCTSHVSLPVDNEQLETTISQGEEP